MKSKVNTSTSISGSRNPYDPGKILIVVYISVIVFFIILGGISNALAEEKAVHDQITTLDQVKQGELLIKQSDSDTYIRVPALSQNVELSISGMVVNANVRQEFINTSSDWIEAVYVFPLPDESAVKQMRMVVGDRVIVGEIKEKEEARDSYERAKREGKKTSLLAQKRPNIFTMAVANIPPGSVVRVEFEYLDKVHFMDNIFSIRFPMVIGPRYIPGKPLKTEGKSISFDEGGWAADTDQVEDASQITPVVIAPDEPEENPVELRLTVSPGFPVQGLTSLYHGTTLVNNDDMSYTMSFNGRVFANRDFVVEYQAANVNETTASLFYELHNGERYTYLMLIPPAEKSENGIPREVIFVLDISGSMAGSSIRQAKSALIDAVARLHGHDRFNVVAFNNNASSFFATPLLATEENKNSALDKISSLKANGGTKISKALRLALDGSSDNQRLRQVVFLTDGAVGNERALFKLIGDKLGDARLFTIGIGSAPNSYFMTRAATMGRGSFSYIGKIEEVKSKMAALYQKLENPVITGLKLEAEEGVEVEMYPKLIPDLYIGEPVIVLMKSPENLGTLHLSGLSGGDPWRVDIDCESGKDRPGISTLWARTKIRSLMDALNLGTAEEEVRAQVLKTAMNHHLVSRYTSLVAVEQEVSRTAENELNTKQVETNLPQGWKHNKVFGTTAKTATHSEMALVVGFVVMILGLLLVFANKRRYA